jgi:putative endonuclease
LGKFYIGACHDNLKERIEKHNNHYYGKKSFTAVAQDWGLYLYTLISLKKD